MRIFSPTVELPFAGHPSVGTAWLLGPRRWMQVTSGATVIVEADEHGARMTQPQPEFEPLEAEREAIVAALGLRSVDGVCRSTAGGITHVLVATSEPLDSLAPDLTQVADASRFRPNESWFRLSRAGRASRLTPKPLTGPSRLPDPDQVPGQRAEPASGPDVALIEPT